MRSVPTVYEVARHARGGPDVDPGQNLAWEEIYVHILRGDKDQAFKALKSYLVANPDKRDLLANEGDATASNWWFRSLEDDPRYRALVFGK